MVGQFIDTCWRKSFIGDLRRARKVSDDDPLWTLIYDGQTHQFQFVWIQGICLQIEKSTDLMIVEDATGQAEVHNCSRIVDLSSVKEGDFVMIAGKLLPTTNSSDRVHIDVYRIHSLDRSLKSEISWPFEVVDISQRVYHYISS